VHAIRRFLGEQVHEGHEATSALELAGQEVDVAVRLQGWRAEAAGRVAGQQQGAGRGCGIARGQRSREKGTVHRVLPA